MQGHGRLGLAAQLLGPGLGLGLRRGQILEGASFQVDQHEFGRRLRPRLQVHGLSRARTHVPRQDVALDEGAQEANQDYQDHPHLALSSAGSPRSCSHASGPTTSSSP